MKILNKLMIVMVSALVLLSCDEEDGRTVFEGPFYVSFTSNTAIVSEADESYFIEVSNVGATLGSEITVNYQVEGDAQEGVDYEIVGGSEGTVVIPAGEHFGTLELRTIDDLSADGALSLTLTLSDNSAGLNNGRGEIGKTLTLTITDDDCPLADGFVGVYSVDEVFTSGTNEGLTLAGAFGESYQVELSADPEDPSGTFFIITNSDGFDQYVPDGTVVQFLTCDGSLKFPNPLNIALFADMNIESTSYSEGSFSLQAAGPLGGFGPYEFVFNKM